MRPFTCAVAVALFVTASASAQNDIAKLLATASQPDVKAAEAAVMTALRSDKPNVRAIAARVANVKHMTALLGAIGSLADHEQNVNAAREELRAMVMLGGLRQVDRAFYISDRFGKRLDADVGSAAAHIGADAAVEAYFASMEKRHIDKSDFFRIALWNRPQAAAALAARLLAKDVDGYETFLFMAGFEPRMLIDSNTLKAGLAHSETEVREATVWYLLYQAVRNPGSFDANLRGVIGGLRVPRDNAQLIAGVEMLRRAIGLPHREFNEFRYALSDFVVQVALLLSPKKTLDVLNEGERRVVTSGLGAADFHMSNDLPPFVLPSALPEGLPAEVMRMTGCNQGWMGTAKVRIDDSGVVVGRDLSKVNTSDACRRALDMLLEYSIAENRLISATRQSDNVTLVRAANGPMCFDEGPAANVAAEYVYGSSFRFPKVLDRATPPKGLVKKDEDVLVEVMVTAQGCVRAARVVEPSANAAVNSAALTTAQQYRFEPATRNTFPIDMLYGVSVEFRP